MSTPSPPSPSALPKPSFSRPLGAKPKARTTPDAAAKQLAKVALGSASSKAAASSKASAPPAAAPSRAPAASASRPIEQYPTGVVGVSSEFSSSDNSARQLLGRPAVYPKAGSSVRAWSPVPREGEDREWVRLLFRTAVEPSSVTVYQSFNPGSLVEVRAATEVGGEGGEASDWATIWRGERYNTDPHRQPSDALELKVSPGTLPVRAIELVSFRLRRHTRHARTATATLAAHTATATLATHRHPPPPTPPLPHSPRTHRHRHDTLSPGGCPAPAHDSPPLPPPSNPSTPPHPTPPHTSLPRALGRSSTRQAVNSVSSHPLL